MVATYTPNLRLTLQGDNDNPNTWGDVTNEQVIELIEAAVAGVVDIDCTGSSNVNISTTVVNGGPDDARNAVLILSGVVGANIDLIVPAVDKVYIIDAQHTGAYIITVKPVGGGSGIAFPTGKRAILYTDGIDIIEIASTGGAATPLIAANNLSDLTNAATARTNLGLGTLATQNANNVNITGGTITGVGGLSAVTSVAGRTGDVVLTAADISGLGLMATQNYGAVVKRAYGSNSTYTTVTGNIPIDNTTPQVTEGTQIVSAALQAVSSTNRLRFTFSSLMDTPATPGSGGERVCVALFRDSDANAIFATLVNAGYGTTQNFVWETVAGDALNHTYSVRVGRASGSTYVNGTTSSGFFNGLPTTSLVIEELYVP